MTLEDYLNEQLKNPEFAREWEERERVNGIQMRYPGSVWWKITHKSFVKKRNTQLRKRAQ